MPVLLVYFSISKVQFWLFFKLSDLFFSHLLLLYHFISSYVYIRTCFCQVPRNPGPFWKLLVSASPEYVGKTLREEIGRVLWLDKPALKWLWRSDRKETKTWDWDSGFHPSGPIGNIGRALKTTGASAPSQKWEPCIAVLQMLPRQFYCAAGMKAPTRDSWKQPETTPRVPKREGFHAGDQRLPGRWKGPGSEHQGSCSWFLEEGNRKCRNLRKPLKTAQLLML